MNVITIGIAGGTGSGKTTITKRIVGEFGDDVTVINYDNYYKAHNDMTYEERSKKSNNPNPSPIGNRFGLYWFGADKRT